MQRVSGTCLNKISLEEEGMRSCVWHLILVKEYSCRLPIDAQKLGQE